MTRERRDPAEVLGFALIGVVLLAMSVGTVCRLVEPRAAAYPGDHEAHPAQPANSDPQVADAFGQAHVLEQERIAQLTRDPADRAVAGTGL